MKSPNKLQYALLAVILIIALIPMAFALPIIGDDRISVWKNYDKATEKITIRNLLNDVVELKLEDNGCGPMLEGKAQCYAEMSGIGYFDLDTITKDYYLMNFENREGKNALGNELNSWEWKAWYDDVETYQIEVNDLGKCKKEVSEFGNKTGKNETKLVEYDCVIGTHKEDRTKDIKIPIELLKDSIPKDKTFHIRLTGEITQDVDWIPTFYGIKLTEWAWWSGSPNNFKRLISINQTTTSSIANFSYPINYSAGLFGDQEVWGVVTVLNAGSLNSTQYLYYDSATSYALVNGSETTQLPHEVVIGSGTSYNPTQVWDDSLQFVGHNVTKDSTVNANTVSISGGSGAVQEDVNGYIGKALKFASADSTNSNTVNISTLPSMSTWTISFWMKVTSTATRQILMTSDNLIIEMLNTGVVRMGHSSGGPDTSNTSITANVWHHVTFQNIASGDKKVYVDGSEKYSATDTSGLSWAGHTRIGNIAHWYTNYPYAGEIDELRIYDRTLSADEIKADYEMMRYNYSTLGAEESPPAGAGDVFVNVNWTALPYYTNSTRNISFMPVGNTSSYNVTYGELNNTVAYGSSYTISDWPNNTLYSNQTDSIQHEGEVWALTVNATPTDASGHNSTNVTIGSTAPDKPTDIPPTPANGSTIGELTPTINISATDIDGNNSLNCNFFMGSSLDAVVYQTTLKTNSDGYCNWTTSALAQGIHYWNVTVGDGTYNSSVTGLKSFTVTVAGVSLNLNWTSPPYFTNSTMNISLSILGNTSSYNVTFRILNASTSYLTYTISNLANNTVWNNETISAQHNKEIWGVTANATAQDTIGYNSTNITISDTAPDLPNDIAPTPANESLTGRTPTINISNNDIDGNESLNCHFYLGTTSNPSYNFTLAANSDGICNWTLPLLSDSTTYYWKEQTGDTELNSSFTPIKNFQTAVGNINVNLNFTDLPYYGNSTINISFDIQGNTTTYNATYNISNGSVQYLLHTVNIANNTLFSNKSVDVAHAGETWNVIVNVTPQTTIGYNTSATTILNTRPDQPLNIPPTPTNNTEISDLTPVINISVNDIDGNDSLNCHFYFGTTVTPAYNFTMQTNNGICNWTTPTLVDGFTYYHKTQVGDSELNSTYTPLETFTIGIGNVYLNVNVTDTPVYTNTTMSVTISALGNTSNYNITLEVLNGTASYLTYTFNLANNTAWINDTTIAQHAGEIWNMSINASGAANSTTVLISYTTPENITDISPTPANDTWTNDNTPVINISAASIDGNTSLNCHLYLGTAVAPAYNQTIQTNAAGNCNFTLATIGDNVYHYWDVAVGNGHTNSSRTATERFRVDTIAPSYAELSPVNNSYISDSTPTFIINLTDTTSGIDNESIEVFENRTAWTNITSLVTNRSIATGVQTSYTFGALSSGQIVTINVSVRDTAGNQMKVAWTWIVDTAAPSSVTLLSPADVATSAVASTIFTANATDALSNLSNATLRIWKAGAISFEHSKLIDVFAVSNKSNTTSITYALTDVGDYVWNYYFCDNATQQGIEPNCAYGTNRTYTYYSLALSLEAPVNGTNLTDSTPDFIFNYTRNPATTGICSLYVNDTLISTDASVTSGVNTTITSTALNDGLQQVWHVNCSDGTNTVTSENRSIGIDASVPVLTILLPIDEYFTQGLPYLNLPLNFSYVETSPDSCWYDFKVDKINQNPANETYCNDTWSPDGPCANTYDSDWTTYGYNSPGGIAAVVWENFSVPYGYNATSFTVKVGISEDVGKETVISIWNYTSNAWETLKTFAAVAGGIVKTEELTLPSTSTTNLNNNTIQIKTTVKRASGFPDVPIGGNAYFEGSINYTSNSSTTIPSCQNTSFNYSASGSHTVYLWMNDTLGNTGSSSSNFSVNLYNVSHAIDDTDGNVSEGESVTFSMQINSTNITSTNATLYYNNTPYGYGALNLSSYQVNFTRTINIPIIYHDNDTIPYYWNYSINSFSNLTDMRNLSVSRLTINNCTGLGVNATLKFFMKDETNSSDVIMEFSAAIVYWTDDQLINRTLNITMNDRLNYSLCIYPADATYSANLEIEYESTTYSKRYYYLTKTNLTSTTDNINLYSLLSSQSTLTTLQVYDQYTSPIENVIIHFQRYDITTDSYYVVGMAKTSHEGRDIAYLEWYDTLYKFLLFQNNEIVLNVNPMKVSESTIEFFIVPETSFHYDIFDDISYTLYFNNDTKNFIVTFADPTGRISGGCLKVINRSLRKDETICDYCEESASATLYCNIGQNATGTYFATFYAKGSDPKIIDSISRYFAEVRNLYDQIGNLDGTTLAIIFAGSASFIGLWNPVVGVLFMILGLLGAMSLGFTVIDWTTFIGLCFIGGLIIWKLKT